MILVGMLTFGALVAIACAISRGTYGRRLARRTAYRTVRRW